MVDAVCRSYLQISSPYTLPNDWAALARDPAAFVGPASPADVLPHLLASHPPEALLRSGLAQRGDDGELQLHPYLQRPHPLVLALIQRRSPRIANLLTDQGCLCGDERPLFAVLEDERTCALLKEPESTLLLTATLEDAIVARALGLAASPIVGVSELTPRELVRFQKRFSDGFNIVTLQSPAAQPAVQMDGAESRSARPSPVAAPHIVQPELGGNFVAPIGLVLVDISLAGPSRESQEPVRKANSYLLDVARFSDFFLNAIGVWAPSDRAWSDLEYALGQRNSTWCEVALKRSISSDTCALSFLATKNRQASHRPDLSEAWHRSRKAGGLPYERDPGGDRARRADAKLDRSVEQEIFQPLLAEIKLTADPVQRAILYQFTDLNQLLLKKVAAELRAMRPSVSSHPDANAEDRSKSDLTAYTKQFVELAKIIQSWQPKPKTSLFGTR